MPFSPLLSFIYGRVSELDGSPAPLTRENGSDNHGNQAEYALLCRVYRGKLPSLPNRRTKRIPGFLKPDKRLRLCLKARGCYSPSTPELIQWHNAKFAGFLPALRGRPFATSIGRLLRRRGNARGESTKILAMDAPAKIALAAPTEGVTEQMSHSLPFSLIYGRVCVIDDAETLPGPYPRMVVTRMEEPQRYGDIATTPKGDIRLGGNLYSSCYFGSAILFMKYLPKTNRLLVYYNETKGYCWDVNSVSSLIREILDKTKRPPSELPEITFRFEEAKKNE